MSADRYNGFPLSQTELVAWAGSLVKPYRTQEELIRAAEETDLFLGTPVDLPQGRQLGMDSAIKPEIENPTASKFSSTGLRRKIRKIRGK